MAAKDFLNWEQIAGAHEEVGVHLHAPRTKKEGFPVFSVVAGGKAIGQVTGGHLADPRIAIDRYHLQEALNRTAKTRNTLIVGRPVPAPVEGAEEALTVRPGKAKVGDRTVFEAQTGRGQVTIRETIPAAERTPGGPTQRQSAPFEGVIVPQQPNRSDVFASGVNFGRGGVKVVREA